MAADRLFLTVPASVTPFTEVNMVSIFALLSVSPLAAGDASAETETQPAPVDTPSQHDHAAEERPIRVVEEAWVRLTDLAPQSVVRDFEEQVQKAGGKEVRQSVSKTDDYVEIDVIWHVPTENWPALRSWMMGLSQANIETQRFPPDEVEGTGPRMVEVSANISTPYAAEPLLQLGPTIGMTAPIAGDGLGLGRSFGARVLFGRDFSMDTAYAAPLGEDPWMLTVTMGGATCSELLGDCERIAFNPFVGARVGYSWRGESWALLQAEVGVELLHLGGFIWEASARPTMALQKGQTALGMDVTTAVLMPF